MIEQGFLMLIYYCNVIASFSIIKLKSLTTNYMFLVMKMNLRHK